jgi:hypothetical protein
MPTTHTPPTGPPSGRTLRTWAGAICLPALPLTLLITNLIYPQVEHTPEAELAAAAANPTGAQLSAFTYLGAAALSIGVTMAIVGAVRGRGAGLANAGAVLGILGGVGMSAIGIHQLLIAAFAASGSPDTLEILGNLGSLVGPLPILFFAAPLAMLVLIASAARAGFVPKTAAALMVPFVLIDKVPVPNAELLQMVLGLLVFGWVGWCLLTRNTTEQDTQTGSVVSATSASSAH